MNEWKELEIDNLPSDIKLSDDVWDCGYEIRFYYGNTWVKTNHDKWWMIIKEITNGTSKYRYRKPEPKAPSHEEIRHNHIKSVNDSIDFGTDGFRDTIIDAVLFLLKSSTTPPETS